ncbi:30S ribosomal protein S1 [Candidatus Babeliales bacterium]|nr:30S ribosomal protein S1 [Candidatus Babeliales bacterium]
MSKEVIRPQQFAHATLMAKSNHLELNADQQKELDVLYQGLDRLKPGQLISGTVLRADSDGVLVDISYKSDGLIPRYEFSEHEMKALKVGNTIEVILDELESIHGSVTLSYEKAKEMRAWERITNLFDDGKPVEGVITHKVKGGLSVDIGVQAFLPGSQVDIHRVTDFDTFVGQTITADIIKLNKRRGNVILSRRKYLSNLRAESRKKMMETLEEGQVVQGVIKNITNYGAFVDIGGVDGLLHITDMTWGRIAHPSEIVRLGDTIAVKILSIDKDNAKISLGMKQLSDNPWEQLADQLKIGARIKGKVSSITDYGLFVEIQKGVEGLVHISEISWTERINDLRKHYAVGNEIEALIVSLDKDNRRMSLSIKQLEQNPWDSISQEFKAGDRVKGTISNITDFGIFVTLKPGIDGLVHISDLSWTEHINHPADLYAKGQDVEAIILGVDEDNKKISLGIKQLTQDPWENLEEEYPRGKVIEGTVSKITNFGAFVKLSSGIEGLVHSSELTPAEGEAAVEVGQTRSFRVINVNREERKLGLSLKTEGELAPQKQVSKKPSKVREKQEPQAKPRSLFQMELERHMNTKNKKDS